MRRSLSRTLTSVGPSPKSRIRSIGQRDDLGVAQRTRLADQVAVELEVLPQPAPLLPFVAEELGDREPADRLLRSPLARAATIRRAVGVISGRSDTSRSPLSVKL